MKNLCEAVLWHSHVWFFEFYNMWGSFAQRAYSSLSEMALEDVQKSVSY